MWKFLAGVSIGIVLGSAMAATAAGLFGEGYLSGWTITKDGEEVCSDPYAWAESKELECD
jgi:hypothetical protein